MERKLSTRGTIYHLTLVQLSYKEPGGLRTVSVDWMIRVQSPVGARDLYSSLCIQTVSGVHPAFCLVGTRGLSLEVERDQYMTLTSPPSSAKVKNEYEVYFLFPQVPPWHIVGQIYFSSFI
jgi:hypothetical protein